MFAMHIISLQVETTQEAKGDNVRMGEAVFEKRAWKISQARSGSRGRLAHFCTGVR